MKSIEGYRHPAIRNGGETITTDTGTSSSGVISQRDILPLPCMSGTACNMSSAKPPPSLDVANAPAPDSLEGIQLILDGLGEIPGVGEAADLLNIVIDAGRGDFVSVGLGATAAIQIIGASSGGAKITKKGLTNLLTVVDD